MGQVPEGQAQCRAWSEGSPAFPFQCLGAEVAYQDKWQRAVIAVCILGGDRRQLESDMARVRQLCEEAQNVQVADMHQQWL